MEFARRTQQLREQGPRQFAAWSDAAFDSYLAGPIDGLKRNLDWRDKENPDTATVENFLRLVYEGIGAGWLGVIQHGVPPTTFLAHCLGTLMPYKLGEVPRAKRGEV